jgi:hypothetical protein
LFLKEFLVILQGNLTELTLIVQKIYIILIAVMLACIGCEWHLRSDLTADSESFVERYDRAEAFFLTTGDFSALQQMQTRYPKQTRRLIEDVLQLGKVDDAHINVRFYSFFQDSTLQKLIAEVGEQYRDMNDIDKQLTDAFTRLSDLLPGTTPPVVYTQIGSLDQSIVVGDGLLGISLDKYLGADYPLYVKYGYTERQRSMMTREFIVPDCLGFYLLSLYPAADDSLRSVHIGRIQYTVNQVLNRQVFKSEYVEQAQQKMEANKGMTLVELLKSAK